MLYPKQELRPGEDALQGEFYTAFKVLPRPALAIQLEKIVDVGIDDGPTIGLPREPRENLACTALLFFNQCVLGRTAAEYFLPAYRITGALGIERPGDRDALDRLQTALVRFDIEACHFPGQETRLLRVPPGKGNADKMCAGFGLESKLQNLVPAELVGDLVGMPGVLNHLVCGPGRAGRREDLAAKLQRSDLLVVEPDVDGFTVADTADIPLDVLAHAYVDRVFAVERETVFDGSAAASAERQFFVHAVLLPIRLRDRVDLTGRLYRARPDGLAADAAGGKQVTLHQ